MWWKQSRIKTRPKSQIHCGHGIKIPVKLEPAGEIGTTRMGPKPGLKFGVSLAIKSGLFNPCEIGENRVSLLGSKPGLKNSGKTTWGQQANTAWPEQGQSLA